jgi:hypothetical protein
MSAPQTPTNISHYFLKVSRHSSRRLIGAWVVSMIPILVDVDAFPLPSRPPGHPQLKYSAFSNGLPSRFSFFLITSPARLIRTIQHLTFEYEQKALPF